MFFFDLRNFFYKGILRVFDRKNLYFEFFRCNLFIVKGLICIFVVLKINNFICVFKKRLNIFMNKWNKCVIFFVI